MKGKSRGKTEIGPTVGIQWERIQKAKLMKVGLVQSK